MRYPAGHGFDIHPSAYTPNRKVYSRQSLKDRYGNVVRWFEAELPRSFSRRSASEAAMRALVEKLARARTEDIYRAPLLTVSDVISDLFQRLGLW